MTTPYCCKISFKANSKPYLFLLREGPLQNHVPALIKYSFVFFDIFFWNMVRRMYSPWSKIHKEELTIGFGTKDSPAAGGSGKMYFDDIRLMKRMP